MKREEIYEKVTIFTKPPKTAIASFQYTQRGHRSARLQAFALSPLFSLPAAALLFNVGTGSILLPLFALMIYGVFYYNSLSPLD